jgi:hypothetical protein
VGANLDVVKELARVLNAAFFGEFFDSEHLSSAFLHLFHICLTSMVTNQSTPYDNASVVGCQYCFFYYYYAVYMEGGMRTYVRTQAR